ncbi:VCBS domain-containing protein [Methylogaea oryzae]|uniref:VCBS domain-containing protein n=1 Tax=Methylogaea oryzae TaxID=1295382 RepID=UPI0006D1C021|nr:VCBS domain-containing protein [Methylogaea oryzae]
MAAQTTIKVATITGAAKDDSFSLTEDSNVSNLNVLSNDPGSAKIYSLAQNTSGLTSTSQYPVVNSLTLASGASISINPDGTIHYDAAGIKGLQSLAAGETYTDTFTYTIRMANGALSTATATVTIVGENDAPVITNATSELVGSVQEDNKTSVSGQLSATDVDHGATQTWSVQGSAAGTYGNLAVDSTGKWTYSLNNDSSNVQSLAAGEHHTESFTVRVTDDKGAFVDQTVTVTVNGTNDAPVVSGAVTGAATEDGASSSLNALANASDVDHNTTLNVTNVPTTLPAGVSYDAGTHTFTLNPGNAAYQSLAQGETTTVTVNYSVSDGITSTPATASWTVTGTNDAPVVSGAVTGTATEDGASSSLNALANASDVDNNTTLSVTDVPSTLPAGVSFDAQTNTFTLNPGNAAYQSLAQGETTTVTVNYSVSDGITSTPATASWTVTGTNDAPVIDAGSVATGSVQEDVKTAVSGQLTATDVDNGATQSWSVQGSADGTYGSLAVDGTGQWTYTLHNSAANVQALAAGESHTETFTVRVADEHGAYSDQTVNVTVTGSNDAAAISGTNAGSVIEDGTTLASGTLGVLDKDAGQSTFAGVSGSQLHGDYGNFTFDAGTGEWTYALRNGDANVQALGAGTVVHDSLTVTSLDGSASKVITVDVNGTNDVATITGTNTGAVKEDVTLTAAGDLDVTDVDSGQSTFAAVSDTALHGTYGNFTFNSGTGAWTYSLRNADANVQNLKSGEFYHDTLLVQSQTSAHPR